MTLFNNTNKSPGNYTTLFNNTHVYLRCFQESKDTGSSKSRRGEKRKVTEAYTAVKLKTPKVLDMNYIDGTSRQQTGTNNNTKQKPTTLMSVNKLRKLKQAGRR